MNSRDSKNNVINELYIWDSDAELPDNLNLPKNSMIVLWSKYSDNINNPVNISIPEIVDANRQTLRSSYLSWVYSIGELKYGGKKITEQFMLEPGLSYWWMTSIAQKFNISSESNINNAIKILAFQGLIDEIKPKKIRLETANLSLIESLKNICSYNKIIFVFNKKSQKNNSNIRKFFLPHEIFAITYLIYFTLKHLLRFKNNYVDLNRELGDILFVDIFTHMQKKSISSGEFSSNYWTLLVNKLEEWKLSVNWLHGFFKHEDIPTVKLAESIIKSINKKSNTKQFHFLLEGMVGIEIIPSVIKDYLYIRKKGKHVRGIIESGLEYETSKLWIFHKDEYEDSIRGKGAMSNCIRISMHDRALRALPKQKLGFYISENQPWEFAFLGAWRKYGHGEIVAVPHTLIRFWDLRYHYDARTYMDQDKEDSLPLPDKFAINGALARSNIISCNYLDSKLVDVEALRFLSTENIPVKEYSSKNSSDELSILVCGDFSFKTTQNLLIMIRSVIKMSDKKLKIYFKTHPAYKFYLEEYSDLSVVPLELSIKKSYIEFDAVFTSTITSAAIEAYLSGVKVIQMLSGSDFNNSPLIDKEAIYFVKNEIEFISAINDKNFHPEKRDEIFFNFDVNLKRWKNIIISDQEKNAKY